MSTDHVTGYLLLGAALAVVIGAWARAWGRRPWIWSSIAFVMTPFGFLFVATALLLRGHRRGDDHGARRSTPWSSRDN